MARSSTRSEQGPERFYEIDALLNEVLELPTGERAAFIESRCAGDHALRGELSRLVALITTSRGFLESPAIELAAPLLLDPRSTPPVPRVGPYRIVREIGRGGMGAVYLGEREDGQFEQRVAIK